ncbi:unnamed protein product [Polarella glacialis]|uniref:J domain-containing protein n=1 Tax=Polarella glacialis TaxID=89957 RepID=A0A813IBL8_POLGL|nr:unnamed protein product [Polarella glacialis]CAE8734332.1 unnamed protein product [Polarella glacialis]
MPVDALPFTVLGLRPGASAGEIRLAYRRLALQHHPDKGGDTNVFQEITAAHEALLEKAQDQSAPSTPRTNVRRSRSRTPPKTQSSAMIGFGKYREMSYESVLQTDPVYCKWVAETARKQEDHPEPFVRFAEFIASERPGLFDGSTVLFGKYKGHLCNDVLQRDTNYCYWVLKVSLDADYQPLLEFAAWLWKHQFAAETSV